MKLVLVLLLALVAINCHEFKADSKVVQGIFETPSTTQWKEEIAAQGKGFYLLYQTWCGHCKRLIPDYDKAADENTTDVAIIAIDCGKADNFCKSMNVKGYPTLVLIEDYDHHYKYQGARTVEAILSFIGGGYKSGKAANFQTYLDEDRKAKEEQNKGLETFKKQVKHYTLDEAEEYYNVSKKAKFTLIYAPWCGHCKNFLPTYQKLQSKQEGKPFEFVAIELTAGQNQVLGQPFAVKSFPTMVYLVDGQWYRYEGARNEIQVEAFCQEGYKAAEGFSIEEALNQVRKAKSKPEPKKQEKKEEKKEVKSDEYPFQEYVVMYNAYMMQSRNLIAKKLEVSNNVATVIIYVSVFLIIFVLKSLLCKSRSKKQQPKKTEEKTKKE